MLMVCMKSASALVLGSALLGQQPDASLRDQTNSDVAPPASTIQNELDRQANDQPVERRDSQPVQENVDARADGQRQTYQDQDQAGATSGIPQDQQGRAALGVSVTDDLTITHVSPGSPAERMGLQPRDEILSVNGQTFDSLDAFMQTVGSTPQGQQVQIEIDRNGQRMTQSGLLATWDQVHYGGAIASTQHGAGYAPSGVQTHSAMRYPNDGVVHSAPVDGDFAANACCDPCAGYGGFYDGGFGYGGYGWGGGYGHGWDDGWSRREARRAARRGYYW